MLMFRKKIIFEQTQVSQTAVTDLNERNELLNV